MKKIIIALVLSGLITNLSVQAESLDDIGDKVFEQKVLEVIMKNPEVIEKTLKSHMERKREAQAEAQFQEALDNRVEIDYADSPTLGKKSAKYHLVVFTDFQCPYCKKGEATVQDLKEEYGDDLYIVHKNFPLGFHAKAKPAAKAALAAHEQGKFFEYAALLFENQSKLGDELYIKLAKDLKLDIGKFKKDMNSEKAQKLLEADMKQAAKVKVGSTPNFFLNGVNVKGAYPLEHFQKIIEKLDAEKKS